MDTDEGLYNATPQVRGKIAHLSVDNKSSSNRKKDLLSLPVYSKRYNLMGKVDVYKQKEKILIERKNQLKQIYQGQIYQLWAQYFCLLEMGYEVKHLAFYEISTNKTLSVPLPNENEIMQFESFIDSFRQFNPEEKITTNPNKCRYCIYCNLCDKTEEENVY